MLKNLAGPFPQVKFMTTGGISTANLGEYAKAANVLAIGGSWMVKADLIDNDNWAEITRLCKEATCALQGFEFAHLGINNDSVEESEADIKAFSTCGMATNRGNSSVAMNKSIEVLPKQGRGAKGHLAFRCNDIERAVYYLENNGFTLNKDSVSLDAKGKMQVCYFNEEVSGFAIHLIK